MGEVGVSGGDVARMITYESLGVRRVINASGCKTLARHARDGDLDPPKSWLHSSDDPEEDYFPRLVYRLITPMALVSLLRQTLTTFDLLITA
jgi:hypothetical protein